MKEIGCGFGALATDGMGGFQPTGSPAELKIVLAADEMIMSGYANSRFVPPPGGFPAELGPVISSN